MELTSGLGLSEIHDTATSAECRGIIAYAVTRTCDMRKLQDWMELLQSEVDALSDDYWAHYSGGGCLCSAWNDDECICGAWRQLTEERS